MQKHCLLFTKVCLASICLFVTLTSITTNVNACACWCIKRGEPNARFPEGDASPAVCQQVCALLGNTSRCN